MTCLKFKNSNKEIKVRNVYCLGLNYISHAREFGKPLPKEPVVFMKPTTSVITDGEDIIIPGITSDCHYEVELVAVMGGPDSVCGYAVGIDVTLRDVQAEAMKNGMPWLLCKGFKTSAPVSKVIPASSFKDIYGLTINLYVNGDLKQTGNTGDLIFRMDRIVEYMSPLFDLEEGDIIFTGTPDGVGPIKRGDTVRAEIKDVVEIECGVL